MVTLQLAQARVPRCTAIFKLCSALSVIHLLLLAYDLAHPARFFNADRAVDRMVAIQGFMSAISTGGGIANYLSSHGNPGDYVIHALLYAVGGQALIIVVQIALGISAIVAIYSLASNLFVNEKASIICATLFGFLPHNLVLCHVLSTEAIFNPLVVLGFCHSYNVLTERSPGSSTWLAGAAFGLAILIRPLLFLWPVVFAAMLLAARIGKGRITIFLCWSMLPMLCWMGFIWMQTGVLSEGPSERDLRHNLYSRIYIASDRLDADERHAARRRFLDDRTNTASLRSYIEFCATYPPTCVKHIGMDAFSFVAKSGIEKLTVEYFDLIGTDKRSTATARYDFQDKATGWRHVLETKGAVGVWQYFMERSPVVGLSSAIGAVAIAILWILACVGVLAIYRRNLERAQYIFFVGLIVFPVYIFGVSQFVDLMQSRHRSPGEFALCLLAVAGLYRNAVWSRENAHEG